jgi:methylase of polypeptide subunit release factors
MTTTPATFTHISALRKLLNTTGYMHYYMAFGNGNRRQDDWHEHASKLDETLRQLVGLLLLNEKSSKTAANALLGTGVYQDLCKAHILVEEGEHVSTNGHILVAYNSILFFCQYNLHFEPPAVYFGPDSTATGDFHIPTEGGGTALDLCSGGAIQAMNIATRYDHVYAVEINPKAVSTAEYNIALNALQDKIKVINASVQDFAAQDNNEFDFIVFNPPSVPIPPELKFPLPGAGGGDGLKLVKDILKLYLPKLKTGGAIEFLGFGLGSNGDARFTRDFDTILTENQASGHILLTGKINLKQCNWFYDAIVLRGALNSTDTRVDLSYKIFSDHFSRLDVNELYFFTMRMEKGKSKKEQPVTVIDLAKNIALGSIILSQPWCVS